MRTRVPREKLKDWELVRYGNSPSPVTFSESVVVFRWKRPADLRPSPLAAARSVERR
jgi:hypothetical protein